MNDSNVINIKCPTCGEHDYKRVDDQTFKCNICGTPFFVTDSQVMHQLYEAINCRNLYEFNRAEQIYQNILNTTEDEKIKVMCYYGRLLSHFGVVYIKDFDGRLVITFAKYDSNYDSLEPYEYYQKIMNSCFKKDYENKLYELNNEYKRIKTELEQDPLFDVFICTKISLRTNKNPDADPEDRTQDSNIANRFYNSPQPSSRIHRQKGRAS